MILKNLLATILLTGTLTGAAWAQSLSNPFSLDEDTPKLDDQVQEPVEEKTSEAAKTPESETAGPSAPAATDPKVEGPIADEPETDNPEKLEPTIPRLTGPVVDKANMLTSAESANLEKKIRAIHQQGGPQLQILILQNLEGFPIEEYSIKVAEEWKLGNKDKGDGVIILMSKEDREVRIEVGQGIEGELTDVESHQIIQYTMIPEFKKGNFGGGFEAAVDTIAGEFGMETYGEGRDLTPPKNLAKVRRNRKQMVSLLLPIIIFFATAPILFKLLGKNPLLRSVAGAAYMGGLTFFLVGQLFFIILAVIFGFFIGLIGPLNFLMVMLSHSGRGSYYGGGGGFGGGGGWSGGGGGFSGGGASGRW